MKRRLIRTYANVIAALRGQTKQERHYLRLRVLAKYRRHLPARPCRCSDDEIFAKAQDLLIPKDLLQATKIMVILVPEHNAMSGGIYSFFSIANHMRQLKRHHGYEVVIMTRPAPEPATYIRNTHFRNAETVFRFEQLMLCTQAKDVYIHLPEYTSSTFAELLSAKERAFLLSREQLHLNILNQNIMLMPPREHFVALRALTRHVTQSVAHHAYFSQEMADRYQLPTLLLPPYTDLSAYPPSSFPDKRKLIIYSPDDAPYKQACIETLARELPEYELREIRDITFDKFMELATQCRFSITFGEGFDGYLNQPILQGGVGLAVYNSDFFPSSELLKYDNLFRSGEEMVKDIATRLRRLASDEKTYSDLSAALRAEHNKLYSLEGYREQLKKLALKHFEIFPADAGDSGRPAAP